MKLLAVDTSTEACSAALLVDGELRQRYRLAPREHSHLVLSMVDQLLSEASLSAASLDALAFGRGPGSFMGIRIAAGVVQGIAFAHDLPVVPVSTLAALAKVAMDEKNVKRVLAAIDARMQEVYWAAYSSDETGKLSLVGEERVLPPEHVPVPESGEWLAAGTGWSAYGDVLASGLGERLTGRFEPCFPSASAIAELALKQYENGYAVPASAAVPVYLRDNVARKPARS